MIPQLLSWPNRQNLHFSKHFQQSAFLVLHKNNLDQTTHF